MIRVFMSGGGIMYPIALSALVVLGLMARTAVELLRRRGTNTALVQNGLDGLLFWGLFALMLGVLGQAAGYYRSLTAVVDRGLLDPRLLWLGLSEGFVSPIFGLLVLSVAGMSWFVLRWWFVRCRPLAR